MTHSNQVWAMDITYVRIHKGWVYLCAVVDWYSRKVLAWRLSNTMDVQFAWMPCKRPSSAEVHLRYSTPTKAANLRAMPSPHCSSAMAFVFQWMEKKPGGTTSLWSTCGAPSSTKKFISKPMTACVAHVVGLLNICSSTIQIAPIRHTINLPLMRRTLQHCRLYK